MCIRDSSLSLSLWNDAPDQLSQRLCMGVGKGPTPTSTVDQACAHRHFPFGVRGTCRRRGGPPAPGALREDPAQKPVVRRLGLNEGPGVWPPGEYLPCKVPSAGAGRALKQDAGPPLRVSAVVFGHRWALEARPCPPPGGAPRTGPGACRSVGEGLPPRATAQLQAARGNVRHGVSLFEGAVSVCMNSEAPLPIVLNREHPPHAGRRHRRARHTLMGIRGAGECCLMASPSS